MMRFGVHMPLKGGILAALEGASQMGCECLQIFSRNPRTWKDVPISLETGREAARLRKRLGLDPFFLHTIYLSSISSEDPVLHRKSREALASDLQRAELLGADALVVHIRMGREPEKSVRQAVLAIDEAMDGASGSSALILLENTARPRLDQNFWNFIRSILQATAFSNRLGLCLDTAHAFASGFDLSRKKGWSEILKAVDDSVGLSRLKLLHANDCRSPLGSGWDRHAHIGMGHIGLRGFRLMVNHPALDCLPVILETPKDSPEDDPRNLRILRGLVR